MTTSFRRRRRRRSAPRSAPRTTASCRCPVATWACSSAASHRRCSARASPSGSPNASNPMALKNKIVSVDEAIAIIRDGDTMSVSGFVGIGTPDELLIALEKRFLRERHPAGLTLVFAAAPGDGKERGLNRLAHKGLVKRVVGGHWGLVPKIAEMAIDNLIEAYNLPLGVVAHLYRDIAARRPGTITRVGLRTFVELIEIDGETWLRYKTFPINVALIRGTTCDPNGNITMEREALTLDNLVSAMAAKNSRGFVIELGRQ